MLTVFLVLFIIAAITFGVFASKADPYEGSGFALIAATVVCTLASVGLLVACSILLCNVATEHTIDQKIEMYQAENTEIEAEIDTIVKEYMAHEKETFASVSPDSDSMTLISLFPDLKSDALVQQQMELHARNAAEIKRLKESKIDLAVKKWLLYFGR